MIGSKKICGVVVLYNPERDLEKNLNSYVSFLDFLYIIDNSENPDNSVAALITRIPNSKYIATGNNMGIAAALNCGARDAFENGADWLLTMDQDSRFEPGNFEKLIEFVVKQNPRRVGVVSPYHATELGIIENKEVEEVLTAMTSGNLVSMYAYNAIKGFDEELFIDAVDWDFCLRMHLASFKVLRLNNVFLKHNLGMATRHHAFSRKEVIVLNYNKIRRYYITRNKLFISFKYRKSFPGYCNAILKTLFRDLRHIVLYEKDKLAKLGYFMKGVFHFIKKRRGKLV